MKHIAAFFLSLLVISFACSKDKSGSGTMPGTGIDTAKTGNAKIVLNIQEERQTIEHFGASDCWSTKFIGKWGNTEKKNLIADYLFSMDTLANGQPKGIGLSIWRFNIGAGSFEQGESSGIADEWRREESFLSADGSYNWNKQAGQQWFLNAARERGLNNFLAFSVAPPVQFAINGKAYGLGNAQLNLKAEDREKFSDFMVNVLSHFKGQGYNFNYLSPFNEPQWDWGKDSKTQEGTGATSTEMAAVIKQLGPKMSAKGLNTKIAFGEAAQWNFLNAAYNDGRGNQINEFFNPSSANYIGNVPQVDNLISSHSYYTTCPGTDLIRYRKDALDAKNRISPGLRLWQTEFGILGDICGQMNGGPKNTDINYGLYVAKVIHHDLAIANVSAWHWWLAVSPYNYSDALVYVNDAANSFNLNAAKTDGVVSDSKQLWCFGNYARFIRPGMVRIGAAISTVANDEAAANTQMITAYKDQKEKKIIIVVVNTAGDDLKYALDAAAYGISGDNLSVYTTNASSNLSKSNTKTGNIVIPAKSVVTLVGRYK
jgi:O-glycosyl hydrolase